MKEPGYFEPLCTARHLSVRFYDWEPSRYAGDITHLIALGLCIICLLREKGTQGVSFKAHVLFLLVFSSRFSNVLFCDQQIYSVVYKLILWQGTLLIVLVLYLRAGSKDLKDSLPVSGLLVLTLITTIVFGGYSANDHGLVAETLWIFSNYLEGFAMLPQYTYCYKDRENTDLRVLAYVVAMGGYQMIFGLHWIVQLFLKNSFLDISSFINGFLGIVCFADFVLFKMRGGSLLSGICMAMDLHLNDAEDMFSSAMHNARNQMSARSEVIEIPSSASGTPMGKPRSSREDVVCHYVDETCSRQVTIGSN